MESTSIDVSLCVESTSIDESLCGEYIFRPASCDDCVFDFKVLCTVKSVLKGHSDERTPGRGYSLRMVSYLPPC